MSQAEYDNTRTLVDMASAMSTETLRISETPTSDGLLLTVSARELHGYLGVGRDFSNWIKDRIEQFSFDPGVDFMREEVLISPNPARSKSTPRPATEYHLTIGMAKELAMVERTPKGKEARRYFIRCEAELRQREADRSIPLGIQLQHQAQISNLLRTGRMLVHVLKQQKGGFTIEEAGPRLQSPPHRVWHRMRILGWVLGNATDIPQMVSPRGLKEGFVRTWIEIKLEDSGDVISRAQVIIMPLGMVELGKEVGNFVLTNESRPAKPGQKINWP